MKKNFRAQQTIEWLLLCAAIVSILVVFAGPGGLFRLGIQRSVNYSVARMAETSKCVWFGAGTNCTIQPAHGGTGVIPQAPPVTPIPTMPPLPSMTPSPTASPTPTP